MYKHKDCEHRNPYMPTRTYLDKLYGEICMRCVKEKVEKDNSEYFNLLGSKKYQYSRLDY